MAAANAILVQLADVYREQLEALLMEFDTAWDKNRLAVEMKKLAKNSPLRLPALIEMIKIDLEKRWQTGQRLTVESYLKGFPELGTRDTVSPDLLQAEYEVRRQFGAGAELSDFAKRFPKRVDELRQLLEQTGASKKPGFSEKPGFSSPEPAQRRPDTIPPSPSTQSLPPTGATPVGLPEQFGHYRICKRLGQGGMGTVYLAHDTKLDRPVALKVPHFTSDDGPDILERFAREARAIATLSHPNICPVYEFDQINGIHYLAMEFIEGRPLSDYVQKDKPAPHRRVAAVVRKLALALEEAHQRKVIHRDLKPSNIMMNQRNEPVIMDFGLARRSRTIDARLTRNGDLLGTPAYMPPEQVKGDTQAMGPRSDIYSLGVILYELLTGRLPFDGQGMEVIGQVLTQEPEPPSKHRPDLDPKLDAICRKAMAKNPDDRYATMTELATALMAYLQPQSQPVATKKRVKNIAKPERKKADATVLSQTSFNVPLGVSVTPQGSARRPRDRRWLWIAAPAAAALVILGIVILIRTKDGNIKVKVNDPNAVVQVDGKQVHPDKPTPPPNKEAPPPNPLPTANPDPQPEPKPQPKPEPKPVQPPAADVWAQAKWARLTVSAKKPCFDKVDPVKVPKREGKDFKASSDKFLSAILTKPIGVGDSSLGSDGDGGMELTIYFPREAVDVWPKDNAPLKDANVWGSEFIRSRGKFLEFNLLLNGEPDASGIFNGKASGILAGGTTFQDAEFELKVLK